MIRNWKEMEQLIRDRLRSGRHEIILETWNKREDHGDQGVELGEALDALAIEIIQEEVKGER